MLFPHPPSPLPLLMLCPQERTLSKAKARQLAESSRVADEGYHHAMDRNDLEQADALQKQAVKVKTELAALEGVYSKLWQSGAGSGGGGGGGDGGGGGGGGGGGARGGGGGAVGVPAGGEDWEAAEEEIVLVPAEIRSSSRAAS